MMKLLAIPVGIVIIYAGVLAGLLFSQGMLNQESIEQILQGAPPPETVTAPVAPAESVDALARQQRAREEALNRREEALREQEQRITMAQQDLAGLYNQLNTLLTDFNASLDSLDEDRDQRLTEVANSLARMEARRAAEAVANLDEAVQVEVLGRITERARGEILTQMDPEVAARILSRFQEPRY